MGISGFSDIPSIRAASERGGAPILGLLGLVGLGGTGDGLPPRDARISRYSTYSSSVPHHEARAVPLSNVAFAAAQQPTFTPVPAERRGKVLHPVFAERPLYLGGGCLIVTLTKARTGSSRGFSAPTPAIAEFRFVVHTRQYTQPAHRPRPRAPPGDPQPAIRTKETKGMYTIGDANRERRNVEVARLLLDIERRAARLEALVAGRDRGEVASGGEGVRRHGPKTRR